jgi:peptide deformylase
MLLDIVRYNAPVLRQKGLPVTTFGKPLEKLVHDMLETMRHARGVGLAAQQIGQALQLAVIDVTGVKERESRMWINGEPVDPEDHMPLLLINATINGTKTKATGGEGCLSFPGLHARISRSQRVKVKTQRLDKSWFEFEASGLLGRAVQHEFDHLQGKLFIDHLSPEERKELKPKIEALARGEEITDDEDDKE